MHKLVEIGVKIFNEKKMIQRHKFTDNLDADRYLNDIKKFPHIFFSMFNGQANYR